MWKSYCTPSMGLHPFAFWDLQIYKLSTEKKNKKIDAILCLSHHPFK